MQGAFKLVVVGGSLGGLRAVATLLGRLPAKFPLPIVVVLHRAPDSDDLVPVLGGHSQMPVEEVYDKTPVEKGKVYIGPAEYHVLVEPEYLSLSTDGPVQYARPSIDVLFETASDAHGDAVIGVLLTGANRDGTAGLAAIKSRGGIAIVQDPKTAEVVTMPESAIRDVAVDEVLALPSIANRLLELTKDLEEHVG